METLDMIGRLVPEGAQRDAVHFAVIPMVAQDYLLPGQTIDAEGRASVRAGCVGIVDPFLMNKVDKGQRFWCFLNPGSITSLRHVWSHTAFPIEVPQAQTVDTEAEHYLIRYAGSLAGLSLEELLAAVEGAMRQDGDTMYLGTDYNYYPQDGLEHEFWTMWERYTGRTRPKVNITNFRCAC